ncbi:MAG TPA: response regulator [Acidobacteriota bacterium]|nr:response regulator [Acidobacteriota bacterium]
MTHVLIVDDNAGNLYLLRMLLQGHGYSVDEARHGAEALVKARQQPPDLIISDLLMPVMDGYTLLRQWKADERLKRIPFVVYTATYTEPRDERLALDLGATAFIVKPTEPEPFMATIEEVLATASQEDPPSVAERVDEGPVLLEEYNEVLVRKLEKKAFQLEASNRELLEEIAERKQAEEALRLRDRAIQEVSQGILITDPTQPDNPIIYASAGVERITGYRSDEVIGWNPRLFQGTDTDPDTLRTIREAITAGRGCSVEILNYRKDGTPFWNALSLNPVHDEHGRLVNFVGVQNDITERKRLEDQLRQSQKMEAIGQLAGGIAHDFNNLLTIITGYSALLLKLPDTDHTVRKSLNAINEAGKRAATLTRQLLGFGRKTILQPKILDLNSVVTETGELLCRLIGEDILFTTVLAPDLSPVKVDPSQLDQILMNLAVNARDAMPTGGRLTIETTNVVLGDDYATTHMHCKAGPYVMLAMTDTGCGMTPDVLARIFEPFFTTKEVGKGTGLGLAMVFGIVQQSGGTINVYSEPGHGTTFKIYFPAAIGHPTSENDPGANVQLSGTETILLVEDDENVCELAVTSLKMYGYKVLTATDGKEALQMVRSTSGLVDLVLTDVVMPNMSGPDLARMLQIQFPHLKILFMSGYTDDAVVRHGLLEADVAFIQKPYTPLGLVQKVRQVLDENTKEAS